MAGMLLRAHESYLPRRVAIAELVAYPTVGRPGGLFMDVPEFERLDIEALVQCAWETQRWNKWCNRFSVEWAKAVLAKHEVAKQLRTLSI